MAVDLRYLVKGAGGINYLKLPLTATNDYIIPISKPSVGTSAFTSTGNFDQAEGTSYYTDFTIDSGHDMSINGPTTIVCSGTFTVNGTITGSTTTVDLPNDKLEYFDGSFSRMPSDDSSVGRSSGGNASNATSIGGARHVNGTKSGNGPGGGGGANAKGANGYYSGGSDPVGGNRGGRQLGLLTIIADNIVINGDVDFDGLPGGNGGTTGNQEGAGGGGGGTSGYLFCFSNLFTQTSGNITANAGDGGVGGNAAYSDGGSGGGGDCGLLFFMSKSFSISGGTIQASVGLGGVASDGGDPGTDGSYIMEFGTGVICIEGDPFLA